MNKYVFRTNLKCNGCIKAITPGLNDLQGMEKWQVDLSSPDRILHVDASGELKDEIVRIVLSAGFSIEIVPPA